MKNNIFILIFFIFFNLYSLTVHAGEQFNFNVTEIEILENGNKFKGTKRGKITTDNGIVLDANTFEYDKATNILNAKGNVILKDTINNGNHIDTSIENFSVFPITLKKLFI